jgi:hypothetical protein
LRAVVIHVEVEHAAFQRSAAQKYQHFTDEPAKANGAKSTVNMFTRLTGWIMTGQNRRRKWLKTTTAAVRLQ